MAGAIIEPRRWLIGPANIIERSALLKLPARKWMTMRNIFVVPATPANARALMDEVDKKQIQVPPELVAACAEMAKPIKTDRAWPTWYRFNNTKFSPLDHQYDALKRIYPLDASALFMAMGTCKSRIAVDWATAHFFARKVRFAVVVAPLTVKVSTWVDELKSFCPAPYEYIDVDSDFNHAKLPPADPNVMRWFMVGSESLSQGKTFSRITPLLEHNAGQFAMVVDESHRIANHKTIITRAVTDMGRKAGVRLIMTGTELKRNVEDLYSQFEFLDPSIIGCGDYFAFRNRYCILGGFKGKQIIGYDHLDELMGLIAPYVFQAEKSILKLPSKVYEQRIIKMQPEQVLAYKQVKKGEMEGFDVKNVLKKTLRLQQVTCGYIKTDQWKIDPDTHKKIRVPVETIEIVPPSRNPKLQELLAICDQVSEPMVIWATSLYEIGIIEKELSKRGEVVKIVGEIPKEERHGIITRFQTGTVPYFIGTASAGGIGTTLTAGKYVVYFSNNQLLVDREQSEDRTHRKGQRHSVTYIDLIAGGTVDVGVLKNLREKRELADYIKGQLKSKIALEKFFDGDVPP